MYARSDTLASRGSSDARRLASAGAAPEPGMLAMSGVQMLAALTPGACLEAEERSRG